MQWIIQPALPKEEVDYHSSGIIKIFSIIIFNKKKKKVLIFLLEMPDGFCLSFIANLTFELENIRGQWFIVTQRTRQALKDSVIIDWTMFQIPID